MPMTRRPREGRCDGALRASRGPEHRPPAGPRRAGLPAVRRRRGLLDAGRYHTCAVPGGEVRCWGFGREGAGIREHATIGDDETPAAAGPVDLGAGRTARPSAPATSTPVRCSTMAACAAGASAATGARLRQHATRSATTKRRLRRAGRPRRRTHRHGDQRRCARTPARCSTTARVRCWGFGFDGRLGYGNTPDQHRRRRDARVGRPGQARRGAYGEGDQRRGSPHLRAPRRRRRALLGLRRQRPARVRRTRGNVGDDETPDDRAGRSRRRTHGDGDHRRRARTPARCSTTAACAAGATAATAGLAMAKRTTSATPRPRGRSGRSISARAARPSRSAPATATPARVLDDGGVRCWGLGVSGQLGSAARATIGDNETPGDRRARSTSATARTAVAIAAGRHHTCALLDDGSVRCWGDGVNGRLGLCSRRHDRRQRAARASVRRSTSACRGVAGAAAGAIGPPPPRRRRRGPAPTAIASTPPIRSRTPLRAQADARRAACAAASARQAATRARERAGRAAPAQRARTPAARVTPSAPRERAAHA